MPQHVPRTSAMQQFMRAVQTYLQCCFFLSPLAAKQTSLCSTVTLLMIHFTSTTAHSNPYLINHWQAFIIKFFSFVCTALHNPLGKLLFGNVYTTSCCLPQGLGYVVLNEVRVISAMNIINFPLKGHHNSKVTVGCLPSVLLWLDWNGVQHVFILITSCSQLPVLHFLFLTQVSVTNFLTLLYIRRLEVLRAERKQLSLAYSASPSSYWKQGIPFRWEKLGVGMEMHTSYVHIHIRDLIYRPCLCIIRQVVIFLLNSVHVSLA